MDFQALTLSQSESCRFVLFIEICKCFRDPSMRYEWLCIWHTH
ncbi:hypothetical protein HanPSC8_Chr01g0005961 [Helianthus annuus]|nr:hypothetical protein HanPSC8_Chr01g0005961 [Helianthus annuus]